MADYRFIDLAEPAPARAALEQTSRIGVDTEFMREKTYFAQLCLVQFSTGSEIWCADPLAANDLQEFWRALTAPAWVLHAGRQDFEVVLQSAGLLPSEVFDTQIAAALAGRAPQIGYANLVADLFGVELEKSQTRADWSRRPLSKAALAYAAEDVAWLLPAREKLSEELAASGRLEWALQDSAELLDPSLYEMPAASAIDRIKGARNLQGRARRAARALAEWRERRAVAIDKPRQWILRDAVLLEIAVKNPGTISSLGQVSDMPSGTVRRAGDEILAVINNAAQENGDDYQPPARPDESQRSLIKAMQKEVRVSADRLGIAAEVLAPRRELVEALTGNRRLRVFQGWRSEQVGNKLLGLLGG